MELRGFAQLELFNHNVPHTAQTHTYNCKYFELNNVMMTIRLIPFIFVDWNLRMTLDSYL